MRCEHEHDDGAYVLGALSPAERAAYEGHLATCSFCREAVADIALLPGLLGRLDPADFAKLLGPTLSSPLPTGAPPRPATFTRPRGRTTRVRILSTTLTAVVVALIVGIGAVFVLGGDAPAGGPTVAMTPVDDSVPVSAQIGLHAADGGTKVDVVGFYQTSASVKPYTIRLMAHGSDHEDEQLGSWVAAPGEQFSMSGVTHFTAGDLSRLELVRNDGKVLLAYDVR